MSALTASACMQDWYSSATWTISPGYVTGLEGRSPLSSIEAYGRVEAWDPSKEELRGGFELVAREDYEELVADLAVAERALEDYASRGLEGTAAYSEYRASRLEREG